MSRMNFTAHVMNVFKEMETSYDEIKNLMFDLYKGCLLYTSPSPRDRG